MWNLTNARTAYTLDNTKPFGRLTDDFALVGGVLYIHGTVFVDGDLVISSNVTGYQGYGTIVVNGTVTLPSTNFCPTTGTLGSRLTTVNNLGIAAVGDIECAGVFEGTAFTNHTLTIDKFDTFYGTAHAATIAADTQSSIIVESGITGQNVPPSMPGGANDPRPGNQAGSPTASLGTWSRQ